MSDEGRGKREWRCYIQDMIGFREKVETWTEGPDREGFVAGELVYDAVLRNLELVGAAAARVPDAMRRPKVAFPFESAACRAPPLCRTGGSPRRLRSSPLSRGEVGRGVRCGNATAATEMPPPARTARSVNPPPGLPPSRGRSRNRVARAGGDSYIGSGSRRGAARARIAETPDEDRRAR